MLLFPGETGKKAPAIVPEVLTWQEKRARALIRAAEIIEKRGWRTGKLGIAWWRGPNSRVCLLGGVYLAGRDLDIPMLSCESKEEYAARIISNGCVEATYLWRWNDIYAFSRKQVCSFLRRAACKEKIKEWDVF